MARGLSKERILMGEVAWAERIRLMNREKAKRYRKGLYVVSWHRRAKEKLIAYKGGKCERCGYCKKYPSAFHFHHKDPIEKSFTISSKMWAIDRLKKEVDKCSLLCANCHAEVHEEEYRIIIESERTRMTLQRESMCKIVKCEVCHTEFKQRTTRQKFCSFQCRMAVQKKVKDPPSKDLLASYIKDGVTWTFLGKKYGVTDNSVKKWAVNYGLKLPIYRSRLVDRPCNYCKLDYLPKYKSQQFCSQACQGLASRKSVRPSKEELAGMIKEKTFMQLGDHYGVNWCTVRDWANQYKIER